MKKSTQPTKQKEVSVNIKKTSEGDKLKIKKLNFDDLSLLQPSEENRTQRSSSRINMKPVNANVSPNTSQILVPSAGNIKVLCRFRPLNEKEKQISQSLCVDFIDPQTCSIKSNVQFHLNKSENNNYNFNFDRIFDVNAHQLDVYEHSAKAIIDSVLEGFNGTIFAYGQTSSGKTYTMSGVLDNPEHQGIIPRMINQVFSHIMMSTSEIEYTVKVSMIEIYMEKVSDLIDCSRLNLNVREDKVMGVFIEDLTEHYVISEEEVIDLMKIGNENRSVAFTKMNANSSRSHSIVIITIHQNNIKELTARTGKLYLVDLAGSEKISKTGATGLTLEEAKTINKSLTTLGMVINSLTDGKSTHIPYRESKLTRVLQESLGGNAKTALIITASPSSYNDAETLSTLRFGIRAKNIKNKPKINKETTVAELKLEIEKLEVESANSKKRINQLENYLMINGISVPIDNDIDFTIPQKELDKIDKNYERINTFDQIEFSSNMQFFIESKYRDFKEKYNEMENKLKLIEMEKENMTLKLIEAFDKMTDNNDISLVDKHNIDDKVKEIQIAYEYSIKSMKDKMIDMEKLLEEKNKISSFIMKELNISFDIKPRKKPIIRIDEMRSSFQLLSSQKKIKDIKNTLNEFESFYLELISLKEKDNKTSSPILRNKVPENNIISNQSLNINPVIDESKLKEKTKFENEKKYILKSLDENSEKVTLLENENNDLKEKIKLLEPKLNNDDKALVKKIQFLEKNIEQINLMYHKLVTQKSELKIANQFLEKKMKKKQEKLQLLENDLDESKIQIKTLQDKIYDLQKPNFSKSLPSNNVVKVIKGGNNKPKKSTTLNSERDQGSIKEIEEN